MITYDLTITVEVEDRRRILAVDIKAAGNRHVLLYRDKVVGGVGRRGGRIPPGIEDKLEKLRSIQGRIVSVRHPS